MSNINYRKRMKVSVKMLSSGTKATRLEERKALKKAQKCRVNVQDSSYWQEQFEEFYHLRTHELRQLSRYAHLVYAFIRGDEYTKAEASVRKGNEVCPDTLIEALNYFADGFVMQGYERDAIEMWLYEEEAA